MKMGIQYYVSFSERKASGFLLEFIPYRDTGQE